MRMVELVGCCCVQCSPPPSLLMRLRAHPPLLPCCHPLPAGRLPISWYKESYTAIHMADMRMRSSANYPGAIAS